MKNSKLWISSTFLLILLILVFAGPYMPFVDRDLKEHISIQLKDGSFLLAPMKPNEQFLLGTNDRGQDMLSIIVMGARETLTLCALVVLVRYLIGVPFAIFAFYSKTVETILKGWQQLFSFMPPIFFIAFFVTLPFVFFSPHHAIWMVGILALLETGRVADIILEHMKETQKRPYIEAGIVAGGTPFKLFKDYYFPVVIPHILILVITDMGRVLFLIAQLGIIHVYVTHTFITDFSGAYEVVNTSLAWPVLFKNITFDIFGPNWIPFSVITAIAITIYIFNMFAEGLQRVFEIRYRAYRSDL